MIILLSNILLTHDIKKKTSKNSLDFKILENLLESGIEGKTAIELTRKLIRIECVKCSGEGHIESEDCDRCHGDGKNYDTSQIRQLIGKLIINDLIEEVFSEKHERGKKTKGYNITTCGINNLFEKKGFPRKKLFDVFFKHCDIKNQFVYEVKKVEGEDKKNKKKILRSRKNGVNAKEIIKHFENNYLHISREDMIFQDSIYNIDSLGNLNAHIDGFYDSVMQVFDIIGGLEKVELESEENVYDCLYNILKILGKHGKIRENAIPKLLPIKYSSLYDYVIDTMSLYGLIIKWGNNYDRIGLSQFGLYVLFDHLFHIDDSIYNTQNYAKIEKKLEKTIGKIITNNIYLCPNIFQHYQTYGKISDRLEILRLFLDCFFRSLYGLLPSDKHYELGLLNLQRNMEDSYKFELLNLFDIGLKSCIKWKKETESYFPVYDRTNTILGDGKEISIYEHYGEDIQVNLDHELEYTGIKAKLEKNILKMIDGLFTDHIKLFLKDPSLHTDQFFEESISKLLEQKIRKESKNFIKPITKIYKELIKIIRFKDPLTTIIELEKISNPISSNVREFRFRNETEYENDPEIIALKNVIGFRFYTFFRARHYELWKQFMKKDRIKNKENGIDDWYKKWEVRIIDFKKHRLLNLKLNERVK